ncbi:PhzF family phenazine biosynthesis protein [Salinarimonas ramus]|uniref:Isomerase n=1 Tax=Salinarimonas ramus TaxID=690164 RepID=A0A917Q3M1_9HYPH|nr:PhzF family phenazine biosynthesis protein [Salinarimonas ramus]GGK19135.1 isomerase [Salinarimonas ramus]
MSRRYAVLDVFTDTALEGNPLAVVLDAQGLDTEAMQRIAREFNLSETVFLLPPEDSRHRARVRIFTPMLELPFAGHPTVGSAVLLALKHGSGGADAQAFGLEETVGIVPCVAELTGERSGRARFRLPKLPTPFGEGKSAADCAMALGLDPEDVGFDRHAPSRHTAGVPYDLVPVRSPEALARIAPGPHFEAVFSDSTHPAAYVYTRVPQGEGLAFRARMVGTGLGAGVREDPATGSAAAAFAGALMEHEPMGDGTHDVLIEQGVEMGRPSVIALQLVIETGALVSAEIGGGAVVVARGELFA